MSRKDRLSLVPLPEAQSQAMIERLRQRAAAAEEAACRARARGAPGPRPPADEAAVRDQLDLARLMLAGGRFTEAEYCFYALFQVERIHEYRWLGGRYDRELRPILRAIERIERSHGLEEDEYFAPDDAPDEWRALDREFESILGRRLEDALAEFGLTELLALRRRDREQYELLRETGRLSFFEAADVEANLLNLLQVLEREAERAAAAEAYWAACSMLGRAAEARLALHCRRRPGLVGDAAARIPRDLRPAGDDPLVWNRQQLAAVAVAGGWLQNLPDERLVIELVGWLAELPADRPGLQILAGDQPWLGGSEYRSSRDAYAALRSSLELAGPACPASATLQ